MRTERNNLKTTVKLWDKKKERKGYYFKRKRLLRIMRLDLSGPCHHFLLVMV